MCGIAGIIGRPEGRSRIAAMTAALRHRGPDESGIYLDDNVALGHTRLSIIDLTSGTQPIHNEDKTLWIVFNGEIFNYPELREELIAKGHRFQTTTDTEVILHLYEEKGVDCLREMNGQFAFAIWDSINKTCFLARDRVGIRPLYYCEHDGRIYFASEIKALFTNPELSREMDPIALDQVFTFWSPLPGRTPFIGIQELPAGHYLLLGESGAGHAVRYWDPPFVPKPEQLDWSPAQIMERIQELLKEAVRIRLRADVPVGTYLSGGLDSSGITALVAKNFNAGVHSFGISFEEDDYDESSYQRDMVEFLGITHSEFSVSNDQIGAALPDVIWYSEKPLLRTAPVPLYLLAGKVREENLKVVLTGEGSDEVFGGYNIFREAMVRRFWSRSPDSQRRADLITRLYPYIFKDEKLKPMMLSFFARGLDQTDDPIYSHLMRWENTSRTRNYFSDALQSSAASYSGLDEVRQNLPSAFNTWDSLAKAQYLEMTIFMSNYLLCSQGDRMAMGRSVEVRMPYLDPNIMEFMGQVPAVWKILGMKEKHLLKKSFLGVLPEHIAMRPKQPYRAPVSRSLQSMGIKEMADELLSEQALQQSGLFNPGRVARLIRVIESGSTVSETDDMALAGILSSQMLHHQFIDNFRFSDSGDWSPDLLIDNRTAAVKT